VLEKRVSEAATETICEGRHVHVLDLFGRLQLELV